MRRSLADGSGNLVIDHRDSPGLSPADVAHVPGMLAVPGGHVLERDTQSCSHCQRMVVLNLGRVRDRAVCLKCHHYICDDCETARVASGGSCVPFKQVLDRATDAMAHGVETFLTPGAVIDVADLSVPGPPRIVVP